MFAGKPIIGLAGGIGSGKSFIASLFADEGFLVLDADADARAAYAEPDVRAALLSWYGPQALLPDSSPNRRFLADRIFSHPDERVRLESLIHPKVKKARESGMN